MTQFGVFLFTLFYVFNTFTLGIHSAEFFHKPHWIASLATSQKAQFYDTITYSIHNLDQDIFISSQTLEGFWSCTKCPLNLQDTYNHHKPPWWPLWHCYFWCIRSQSGHLHQFPNLWWLCWVDMRHNEMGSSLGLGQHPAVSHSAHSWTLLQDPWWWENITRKIQKYITLVLQHIGITRFRSDLIWSLDRHEFFNHMGRILSKCDNSGSMVKNEI